MSCSTDQIIEHSPSYAATKATMALSSVVQSPLRFYTVLEDRPYRSPSKRFAPEPAYDDSAEIVTVANATCTRLGKITTATCCSRLHCYIPYRKKQARPSWRGISCTRSSCKCIQRCGKESYPLVYISPVTLSNTECIRWSLTSSTVSIIIDTGITDCS